METKLDNLIYEICDLNGIDKAEGTPIIKM